MNPPAYPIPARLNLCLSAFVVLACIALLWASGQVQSWWAVAGIAVVYGFVMNTGYCRKAGGDVQHIVARCRAKKLASRCQQF
jgi:hypothetical protein